MSDIDTTNGNVGQPAETAKKGFLAGWQSTVTAITLGLGLAGAACKIGYTMGAAAGGEKYQSQINDLRDKLSIATTSAALSAGTLKNSQEQIKQWQDAYKALTTSGEQLAVENTSLKEQIKQLEPCGFFERQIDSLEASISATGNPYRQEALAQRRDKIQEQLSTCRH
ncbi:hypothetical protein [Paraburkholderia strydomiana]|uniref:hypothetical protein n=1 Tax=Paraburkholderia strydomiana TaxID=1245417 RepID=UPI00286035BE|nr:hypothetical protein [Paraburkholderia strydomiana]MDR7006081.1 septal ring factor EnvC (AmiA/AmiB activator) [Paraburkholderia strydomiana]